MSKRLQGFTRFVDDAERWRQLMEFEIEKSLCVNDVQRIAVHVEF
jgi:hypothetical protein